MLDSAVDKAGTQPATLWRSLAMMRSGVGQPWGAAVPIQGLQTQTALDPGAAVTATDAHRVDAKGRRRRFFVNRWREH